MDGATRQPDGRRWRRRGGVRNALGLAVVGAAMTSVSAQSIPSITQNPTNTSAYDYLMQPFHCQQPTVDVHVDSLNVIITFSSYHEATGDIAYDEDDISTHPFGRTTYAMATFDESVAYQSNSVWDANDAISVSNAWTTQPAGTKSFENDPYFYRGTCNVAADLANYPTVNTLTKAVTATSLTPGSTTADITSPQTLGCTCPSYSITPSGDGFTVDNLGFVENNGVMKPNVDAADNFRCLPSSDTRVAESSGGVKRVFYTTVDTPYTGTLYNQSQAINTNYWSVRQTTCGATFGDDCTADGKFNVLTENQDADTSSVKACSLRTESVFIMPVTQFTNYMVGNGYMTKDSSGSKLSYSWNVFAIEYASTKENDPDATTTIADVGIDVFQTRVTPNRFQMDIYPTGAVVERLASGDVAPPMLIHTTTAGALGPVAVNKREDADTLAMTWQVRAYIQQSNAGGATAPTTPDTILYEDWMNNNANDFVAGLKPDMTPVVILNTAQDAIYDVRCASFTKNANDEDMLGPIGESTYSCAAAGCAPVAQADLPQDLLSGLLSSVQTSTSLYWVEYYMTITCTFNSTAVTTISEDFKIPPVTIKIPYALYDPTDAKALTDLQDPPFVQFKQAYYRSPGIPDPTSVKFPLSSKIVQLNEDTISASSSLSDIIYKSESNTPLNEGENRLAFSEAMALMVQLTDPATRDFWQVAPQLVLIVAHDFGAGGEPADWRTLQKSTFSNKTEQGIYFDDTTDTRLDTDWCGLDLTSDIAGAWAVIETKNPSNQFVGNWLSSFNVTDGDLTKLGPEYNTIEDSMTPQLRTIIANLLTNNGYSNFDELQGNLMPNSNTTGESFKAGGAGVEYWPVATVPDSTGGFAFPLRNRFVIDGKPAGYSLSFCTITQAIPYIPMAVSNTYPLYATKAAALADTAAVGGVVGDPIVLEGMNWLDGDNNWVRYFMPARPISTDGLLCMDTTTEGNADVVAAKTTYSTKVAAPKSPAITGRNVDETACYDMIYKSDSQLYGNEQDASGGAPGPAGGVAVRHRRMLMAARKNAAKKSTLFSTQITVPRSVKDSQPRLSVGASVKVLPQRFTTEDTRVDVQNLSPPLPPPEQSPPPPVQSPPPPVQSPPPAQSPPPPVQSPSPLPVVAAPAPEEDKTTQALAIAAISVGGTSLLLMACFVMAMFTCMRRNTDDKKNGTVSDGKSASVGSRARYGTGLRW